MTPPHGTNLKDTGEREAAKTEEAAHMHRCENEPGGPVCNLKREMASMHEAIDEMAQGFVGMRATFKTWGKAGTLALSVLALAVSILVYLQAARDDRGPRVVPQAQAAQASTSARKE